MCEEFYKEQERVKKLVGDWIEEHGSEHLKRAHGAGYDCTEQYAKERAALEFPSLVLDIEESAFHYKKVDEPSESELDALEDIQKLIEGYEGLKAEICSRREWYDDHDEAVYGVRCVAVKGYLVGKGYPLDGCVLRRDICAEQGDGYLRKMNRVPHEVLEEYAKKCADAMQLTDSEQEIVERVIYGGLLTIRKGFDDSSVMATVETVGRELLPQLISYDAFYKPVMDFKFWKV